MRPFSYFSLSVFSSFFPPAVLHPSLLVSIILTERALHTCLFVSLSAHMLNSFPAGVRCLPDGGTLIWYIDCFPRVCLDVSWAPAPDWQVIKTEAEHARKHSSPVMLTNSVCVIHFLPCGLEEEENKTTTHTLSYTTSGIVDSPAYKIIIHYEKAVLDIYLFTMLNVKNAYCGTWGAVWKCLSLQIPSSLT